MVDAFGFGPDVSVTLPADVWGLACELGDGSAAAGIELALRQVCAQRNRTIASEFQRDAVAVLRVCLLNGPAPVKIIIEAARNAGISVATLKKVKRKHGVIVTRRGGFGAKGEWYWAWPEISGRPMRGMSLA